MKIFKKDKHTCGSCGTSVYAGDKYCRNCSIKENRCENCGGLLAKTEDGKRCYPCFKLFYENTNKYGSQYGEDDNDGAGVGILLN